MTRIIDDQIMYIDNINDVVDDTIKVCRLGFNPTSRNWDIESKLAKVA